MKLSTHIRVLAFFFLMQKFCKERMQYSGDIYFLLHLIFQFDLSSLSLSVPLSFLFLLLSLFFLLPQAVLFFFSPRHITQPGTRDQHISRQSRGWCQKSSLYQDTPGHAVISGGGGRGSGGLQQGAVLDGKEGGRAARGSVLDGQKS